MTGRMLDEPEPLHRENGQHARHQVQHEAAQERQPDRLEQCRYWRIAIARERPRRRRQRECVTGDAAVEMLGHDQHTVDRGSDRVAQGSARHVETDTRGVDAGSLWRREIDRAPPRWVEPDLRDPLGHQAKGFDRKPDVLGRGHERRGPGAWRRHALSRGGDQWRAALIDWRRAGRNRQRQRDGSIFGDARLLADEPACVTSERDAGAWQKAGRGRHRDRKHHLAGVAVSHRRSDRNPFRKWPGNLTRDKPRRQSPLDPWRLTGVSGVHPVCVPTRRNALVQGHPEGLAGRDSPHLAHEHDPNLGALGPGRSDRRCGAGQEQECTREDREEAAEAHAGLIIPLVRARSQAPEVLTAGCGYDYG